MADLLGEARLGAVHGAKEVLRVDLARVEPRLRHRLRALHHLPLLVLLLHDAVQDLLLLVAAQQMALLEAVALRAPVLVLAVEVAMGKGVARVGLSLARGAHKVVAVLLAERAAAVLVNYLVPLEQRLRRAREHLHRVGWVLRLPVEGAENLICVRVPMPYNVAAAVVRCQRNGEVIFVL